MILKVCLHTADEDNYIKEFFIWDEYTGNALYVTGILKKIALIRMALLLN